MGNEVTGLLFHILEALLRHEPHVSARAGHTRSTEQQHHVPLCQNLEFCPEERQESDDNFRHASAAVTRVVSCRGVPFP